MALDTYAGLQSTVLNFLGRPGDPAVAPFVPDMVRLFEAEANRRLRVVDAEKPTQFTVPAGESVILPNDCWAVRSAWWNDRQLEFRQPGDSVFQTTGVPRFYNLSGYNQGDDLPNPGRWMGFYLYFGPQANQSGTVTLLYQVGVPVLEEARPANWLLITHPDAYLFGTLVEAEAFIGNDERAPMWLARRDAAFASIEAYDRKTRWAGPLTIRPDIWDLGGGSAGGGGGAAPATVPAAASVTVGDIPPAAPVAGSLWWNSSDAPGGGQLYVWYIDPTGPGQWVPASNEPGVSGGPVNVVTPASGGVVVLDNLLPWFVNAGPLAALTIRLPASPVSDSMVEIGFLNPVTALAVQDAGAVTVPTAPTSAYGPGAALVFKYVNVALGWILWK